MARTIFRPGQPLDPRTLTYFAEMVMEALRQLRLALGTGYVFYGFDVRQPPGSPLIEVTPGLAFDGAGQPVALDSPLRLPGPDEEGPFWLGLRHHLLVDERDVAGRPTRERDSVEVVWLSGVPRDDETIPLARLQRGPAGWLIDTSVARRAPSLSHRHTGAAAPDRSGRLRYDGAPARQAPLAGQPSIPLERLRSDVAVEFDKLNTLLHQIREQQRAQAVELEELRAEVAEAAERSAAGAAGDAGGWQQALAALREELALTAGEELREELEMLRAEVVALAERPVSMGPDLGGFTPVQALRGIGERFARVLNEAGIHTVSDLLAAIATPEGREQLAATRLSLNQLRRWSREADLLRLHGVGWREVILLDSVGVGSTAELAIQEPTALYQQLRKAAEEAEDPRPPALAWVESWVEQARRLPPVADW